MINVKVLGDSSVTNMFRHAGYNIVEDIAIAELVCFTGGADVSPILYNEGISRFTGIPDEERDAYEQLIYNDALDLGIPMVGICRGAQLLCVLNGGSLYQHVEGHTVSHTATELSTGKQYGVTSTHHQMMNPVSTEHEVLMACMNRSPIYLDGYDEEKDAPSVDYEVVYFSKTKCLASQPHPEYMEESAEYVKWFFEKVGLLVGGT